MKTGRGVGHLMSIGSWTFDMFLRENEDATWTASALGQEATDKVKREAIAELVRKVQANCPAPSSGGGPSISSTLSKGGF